MEQQFRYQVQTDFSYFNQDGMMKIYGYQHLFAQLVDQHLEALNLTMEDTLDYGLAWVLRSISLTIKKKVPRGEILLGRTWHSQRKGPYFRREYEFCNQQGEILVQGSSFSILLDMGKRSIYRAQTVPFAFIEPTEEFLLEASPSFKCPDYYDAIEERVVRPSHIDGIGHVNNARYGEFAYDALTESEIMSLPQIQRIDYYFLSEMALGTAFQIMRTKTDSQLFLRGKHLSTGKTSFDIILTY